MKQPKRYLDCRSKDTEQSYCGNGDAKAQSSKQTDQHFIPIVDFQRLCDALNMSPREVEIAHLLLLAKSEAAIAQTLCISTHTVHSHLERLYRKLAVRSRCELIICLFRTYIQLRASL